MEKKCPQRERSVVQWGEHTQRRGAQPFIDSCVRQLDSRVTFSGTEHVHSWTGRCQAGRSPHLATELESQARPARAKRASRTVRTVTSTLVPWLDGCRPRCLVVGKEVFRPADRREEVSSQAD